MNWLILTILALISGCLANTETHLIKIPYHYEIPPSFDTNISTLPVQLNETTKIINQFPIDSVGNEYANHIIEFEYNSIEKPLQTILVKVNNYHNTTFTADDLIFVKVCWPATNPYDIDISHIFTQELNNDSSFLDLYLIIQYQMYAQSFSDEFFTSNEPFSLQLYMTKLPNRLPIPVELYEIIMYLVNLTILIVAVTPYLWNWLFEETKEEKKVVELKGEKSE